MEKFVLNNGLTVVFDRMPTDSVALNLSVRVGSNNEEDGSEGISHFLEHMLFEGTKKRRSTKAIANEIERLGGKLNAGTLNDHTLVYVKVPRKYFTVSLDVLSDITENSTFPEKGVRNNRKVILDEINMVNDEPLFYQWVLFYRELFKNTPVGKPLGGNAESVKKITQDALLEHYRRHYSPSNMVLGVTGGLNKEDLKQIERYFTLKRRHKIDNAIKVPRKNKNKRVVEKRDISQSYMILGYRTVPLLHEDSYALDVIEAVLGRGQSGWMPDEVRNKKALAYNVDVENSSNLDYGLFAVNVCTKKKNVNKVVDIITKNFRRLQNLKKKELDEAKSHIEGNRILEWEEPLKRAESVCFYEHAGDFKAAGEYISRIKAVTLDDVKRVAEEYLTEDYTLTLLEENS